MNTNPKKLQWIMFLYIRTCTMVHFKYTCSLLWYRSPKLKMIQKRKRIVWKLNCVEILYPKNPLCMNVKCSCLEIARQSASCCLFEISRWHSNIRSAHIQCMAPFLLIILLGEALLHFHTLFDQVGSTTME